MKKGTTISIFISSTFNDMQSERDYIRKYIIPRLTEELSPYNITILLKDLRWGVNTKEIDEGERESQILHVCLDAINHSRPFFIALLGDRYGWMPSINRMKRVKERVNSQEQELLGELSEKSVTELEILFGAIGSSNVLPHSLFLFRAEESYNGMDRDSLFKYRDCAHSEPEMQCKAQKLNQLKQRIIEVCQKGNYTDNVMTYSAKWNEYEKSFSQLDQFGETLYQALLREIKEEIDTSEYVKEKSEHEFEKEALERYIDGHLRSFKGREALLDTFERFLLRNISAVEVLEQKYGYFLSGFSGCGKSALFSALTHRLESLKEQEKLIVLAHSAGISPNSFIAEKMILRWIDELCQVLGLEPLPTNQDNCIDNFKALLLRAQSKGYKPVILIDSLDNFSNTEAIKEFDFIPYNVPFICTTLPQCADELLKKQSHYGVYDVDSFSYDDAREVILGVMKENSKVLSEDLIVKLLAIKTTTGMPAYNSPLWLRMSLSILMEIGQDDFKEIHKGAFDKEETKIEVYLQQLIESFPGDAVQQFQFLLDLTYHYFNPPLTKQALTYIALSGFGMKENSLEALLSKEWSLLDFTSVRYWLRYFINRNYDGQKWNFSHNKLKESMMMQETDFLESCKMKLLTYLREKVDVSQEDKEEYIYQLVTLGQYDMFMEYMSKEGTSDICKMFKERFLVEMQEKAIVFIDHFSARFYKEGYNQWIEYIIADLLYESNRDRNSEKTKKALKISNILIGKFTETDYTNGNRSTLCDFYKAYEAQLEYYDFHHMFDQYEHDFIFLKQVHTKNKALYGHTILGNDLRYTFFRYWSSYLGQTRRRLRGSDDKTAYHEEVESLFCALEEWAEQNWDESNVFDVFRLATLEFTGRMSIINQETSVSYLKRILAVLKNIMPNQEDEYMFGRFTEALYELLQKFKDILNKDCHQTEMLSFIIQNGYKLGDTDFSSLLEREIPTIVPTSQYECKEEEREGVVISLMTEEQLNDQDDGEEWDLYDLDSDQEIEPTLAENMTVPSQKEIDAAELALDQFLRENEIEKADQEEIRDRLDQYFLHFINLATLHQRNGSTDRALQLTDIISTILLRTLFSIGDNYAMRSNDTRNLIDLSTWYGQWGVKNRQRALLESVSYNLLHSFLHHIDGEAQRHIFNELTAFYEREELVREKWQFEEQMFEIAFRSTLTTPFRHLDCRYDDLSYIRPIFHQLFRSLRSAGEIKRAVIACEKWLKICEIVYCDNKDTGYGYDEYDETYDRLASLYDGTPALIEGMIERNSIFLREKCILVCHNGKWGYISHLGQEIIPCIYERGWKESEGVLSICSDKKWGYIDITGRTIIKCILDVATPFSQGYAQIKSGNRRAILNPDGSVTDIVIKCKEYCEIKEGLMKVRVQGESHYWHTDFMKLDGKTLLFDGRFSIAYSVNGNTIVAGYYEDSESIMGIFNTQGIAITPMIYESILPFGQESLAMFRKENKCGYMDRSGNEVIPPQYAYARPMFDGIAAVSGYSSGTWGFVNQNGEEITKLGYNDVGNFHEQRAWVCQGEVGTSYGFKNLKFGFIDPTGKLIIPMIYDDVSSFYDGKALVFADDEMFYIDTNGNRI